MEPIEDIHLTYHYEQSRRQVFHAWVSESTVIPPVTRNEIDLRVGGKVRLYTEMEGRTSVMTGEYKVVAPPDWLEYTWEWDKNGELTTVSVTFKDVEGGSEVQVSHAGFTSPESRANHAFGWDSYLCRLQDKLEKESGLSD